MPFPGPPIRGTPWEAQSSVAFVPAPSEPSAPPKQMLVPYVPTDDPRLRQHTQKTADIINSLIQSGAIVQTGPNSFSISPDLLNGLPLGSFPIGDNADNQTGITDADTVAAVSGTGDDGVINNNFAALVERVNLIQDLLAGYGLGVPGEL